MTLPLRTSLAAAMMSSGRVWLSVPISSFGPHLPQFLYFSAASRRSWRVIFLDVMEIPFFWECLKSLLPVSSRRCGQGYGTGVYCAARKGDDSINERIEGGCHGGGFACSRLHRRAVLARGRYRRLVGADLSHTAGPTGRALWGRRSDRCDRAHRRAEIVRDLGAAGLHRKHSRRGRQHRRGHGGTRTGRRLHDPRGEHGLHGQPEHVPYDPIKDFSPITLVAASPNVISVNPGFPAKTLKELVDLVKGHPGKYSFAQPSTGSTPHLAGELFKQQYQLDLVTVPFNSAALAINSTIGGHTPIAFTALPPAMANIRDGKLRGLAVLNARRSPSLPDVPTNAEAGIPDLESDTLTGIVAPAGTPRDIIDRWRGDVAKAVAASDVKERLETLGFAPVANMPD